MIQNKQTIIFHVIRILGDIDIYLCNNMSLLFIDQLISLKYFC